MEENGDSRMSDTPKTLNAFHSSCIFDIGSHNIRMITFLSHRGLLEYQNTHLF